MTTDDKLRQQVDCKLERREQIAVDLFESLTGKELTALLDHVHREILNGYVLGDKLSKLHSEILFLGLSKVGTLADDRQKFKALFEEDDSE
jgi:hypothetical protein